ncbi:DNA adenine methylase [Aeribacillus sp. FSL K6-8210]|mgnify:FL=1|uniref:DNA adenine methylase n=1 Tax=Aeribacillus sp. FSL K6-8210 TaxID=2954683 RepID=UPI0030CEB7CE
MSRTTSPLRYPGGKNKFYKKMVSILERNKINNVTYVEPFAGGAGLAISLLINNKVKKIILNDYDRAIFAFWYSILNYTDDFCQKIIETDINISEWYKQKEIQNRKHTVDLFELGFSTFFLNRTNRSGILKAGPIGGYRQTGKYKIDCRFNKEVLITTIKNIAAYKNNIELTNLDALDFINQLKNFDSENYFIFFDPPYYNNGKELYVNFYTHEDHITLSHSINNDLKDFRWIMTYDNCDEIKQIYKTYKKTYFKLTYTAGKARNATEVVFYNNIIIPRNI